MSAAGRDVELALLTPVLELAVLVAQAGTRAVPRVEPPALLRPYVGFSRKVPRPALKAARRVLDDDDTFRSRLGLVVTEELVGEAGVLMIQRPDGWADRLVVLVDEARQLDDEAADQRDAKGLGRALERTDAALKRANDKIADLNAEIASLREQLASERSRRVELDAELRTTVSRLDGEVAARELADRRLGDEQALRTAAQTLSSEHTSQLRELLDERDRRGPLDAAVRSALDAVQQVHAALLLATSDLDSRPPERGAKPVRASAPVRRRVPLRLPAGSFDDSPEAAAFLLRVPNVLVLVDGYNLAMREWPSAAPTELRRRVEGLLAALPDRTGAKIHVVYDGTGEAATTDARSRLRVSFTSGAVEADDAILALVKDEPLSNPVVVVSADRRVTSGAEKLGATALDPAALVALARSR